MIEIIAKEGKVLTQAQDVPDDERIYVHRVFTPDAALWKEIDETEIPAELN